MNVLKYWEKILISRLYEQFLRNDSTMAPDGMAVGKNFKLLKYEHVIYIFEARDLEISNIKLLSRNI